VWQDGFRGWRGAARLQVRLAAVAMCLVAAGAGAITAACHLVARTYLMRQAEQQLRSYTGFLTSRPFTVFPGSRTAPGASGLGGAGRALSIEVCASGGLVLIGAGPALPAGGGSWLTIAEPIHYQAHHILFVYGAEDTSLSVTGTTSPGVAGTLRVGLDLASTGQAVDRLTIICLAVSGIAALLIACATAGVTRVLLRPVTRMAQTADAVAAGDLVRRMPLRRAHGDIGRLARSFNRALSQAEQTLSAKALAEAAARDSSERMCRVIADTACNLRRPVSVLAGLSAYYRERGRPGNDDVDGMMRQVADQASRIELLLDALRLGPFMALPGGRPDESKSGSHLTAPKPLSSPGTPPAGCPRQKALDRQGPGGAGWPGDLR
jgi:two-component system, OmpR family, sensor kinase